MSCVLSSSRLVVYGWCVTEERRCARRVSYVDKRLVLVVDLRSEETNSGFVYNVAHINCCTFGEA